MATVKHRARVGSIISVQHPRHNGWVYLKVLRRTKDGLLLVRVFGQVFAKSIESVAELSKCREHPGGRPWTIMNRWMRVIDQTATKEAPEPRHMNFATADLIFNAVRLGVAADGDDDRVFEDNDP